jgi:hypothetical protein
MWANLARRTREIFPSFGVAGAEASVSYQHQKKKSKCSIKKLRFLDTLKKTQTIRSSSQIIR